MSIITINANALHIPLADASVQCIATSPPYYGLRKYDGVEPSAWPEVIYAPMPKLSPLAIPPMVCCLGLEPTPEAYVAHMVAIGRELRRVLRGDGVFWLNLGDSYAGGTQTGRNDGGRPEKGRGWAEYDIQKTKIKRNDGLKPKDICAIPWRVALALQADGWWLRSDIIWAKPNPMPESVTDRPTKAHEYIFLLAKSERYYWDQGAVMGSIQESSKTRQVRGVSSCHKNVNGAPGQKPHTMNQPRKNDKSRDINTKRNIRTVWTVATQPYSGAHFATWPPKLVEPMILAGSRRGDIVLDPFCGSGTTGRVAIRHNRYFIGLDLSREYLGELATERMDGVQRVLEMA